MTHVVQDSEIVGSTGGVPLPGSLSPNHQGNVEEEEGRHQQEAHDTRVRDEGKGERTCRDLTYREAGTEPHWFIWWTLPWFCVKTFSTICFYPQKYFDRSDHIDVQV